MLKYLPKPAIFSAENSYETPEGKGAMGIFPATVAVILFGSLELVGFSYGSGFGETSVATLWSVLLLGMTSWVCFRVAADYVDNRQESYRGARLFWRFLAFSFAFLALDDGLQVHEGLDKLIHWSLGLEETAVTDRLDDIIVLAYALAGAFILYVNRSELVRVPGTVELLYVAFGLAVTSAFFDVLTNRQEYLDWFGVEGATRESIAFLSTIAEEGTKLLAGATLLFTFSRFYRLLVHKEAHPPKT